MPKRILPLTPLQIDKAKPKDKKLTDGGGLYILITPTGGKLWRLDYAFAGKRKTLAFGAYPAVSLSDARKRREDAKHLLANGVDPGEVKKAQKEAQAELATTFEVVAREWYAKNTRWSDSHATTVKTRLEHDVYLLNLFI